MCVCVRVVFVSVDLKCSLDRERVDIEEKTFHMYDTNILELQRIKNDTKKLYTPRNNLNHSSFYKLVQAKRQVL